MSRDQLNAFLEKVKADTTLQDKLKEAADVDTVVSIAEEVGFSISGDDLKNAQSELSDKELEGVAGGGHTDACTDACVWETLCKI